MEEKHSSCLWTVLYNFQIKDFVIVILVIVIIIVVTIIVIMIAVIVIIAVLIAIVIIVIIVFIIVVIIVTESSFEVELYPEPWSFFRTNFPWPFTGH